MLSLYGVRLFLRVLAKGNPFVFGILPSKHGATNFLY